MNSGMKIYGYYLLSSNLLMIVIYGACVYYWFPKLYFNAMDVNKIIYFPFLVMLAVGPVIFLFIFKNKRLPMVFGVSGMGICQLAVLIGAVAGIFYSRPVYAVFNVDRFTVVAANDIPSIEMNKVPQLTLPISGPLIVAAQLPSDKKDREYILFSSIESGVDLAQMPQYYLPYKDATKIVQPRIQPMEMLIGLQPEQLQVTVRSLIAASLTKHGLREEEVGYVPLQGNAQDMTVLLKRVDATVIDILPIAPW